MTIPWLACIVPVLLAIASLFRLGGTAQARERDIIRIAPARRTGRKPPPRPPQVPCPLPR